MRYGSDHIYRLTETAALGLKSPVISITNAIFQLFNLNFPSLN